MANLLQTKRPEEAKLLGIVQAEPACDALASNATAEARAAVAEAQLAAILASSSWRLTRPLRTVLGCNPAIAQFLRRMAKLTWWMVTGQLPVRLRAWHNARRKSAIAAEFGAGAVVSDLPPSPTRVAKAEKWGVENPRVGMKLLAQRLAIVESLLDMERGRIDCALGNFEGVTAQIDAYHAYRKTDEYLTAYATAEPLVSICVATVDRAELLLERAIASLRTQSYRNLQIVVVGDNCIDDTAQRLAAVGDGRIQFVNLTQRALILARESIVGASPDRMRSITPCRYARGISSLTLTMTMAWSRTGLNPCSLPLCGTRPTFSGIPSGVRTAMVLGCALGTGNSNSGKSRQVQYSITATSRASHGMSMLTECRSRRTGTGCERFGKCDHACDT